jgi:predicted Holliday junction resolvase-like endonuclease
MATLTTILLFLIGIVLAYIVGKTLGSLQKNREWEKQIPNIRKDAISRSRAVLGGQFSEQLAPYFPNFKYSPTECKFLGKPIDFIVFEGLDEGQIKSVKFVEVKTGKSKLSKRENSLKEAVENKKVSWEEFRLD